MLAYKVILSLMLAVASELGVTHLALDLAGDGRSDAVDLVERKHDVIVLIHFGNPRRKPERFLFAVDSWREDGICRLPARLRPERSGFALIDGACDAIHFVWNRKTQRVEWWRL
jgi:hypothetical protein